MVLREDINVDIDACELWLRLRAAEGFADGSAVRMEIVASRFPSFAMRCSRSCDESTVGWSDDSMASLVSVSKSSWESGGGDSSREASRWRLRGGEGMRNLKRI